MTSHVGLSDVILDGVLSSLLNEAGRELGHVRRCSEYCGDFISLWALGGKEKKEKLNDREDENLLHLDFEQHET